MRKIHLNLWQRIGVVLSLLFVFGFGTAEVGNDRATNSKIVSDHTLAVLDTCNNDVSTILGEDYYLKARKVCEKQYERNFEQWWKLLLPLSFGQQLALIYAIYATACIPAWGIAYAAVYTIRWILDGRKRVSNVS